MSSRTDPVSPGFGQPAQPLPWPATQRLPRALPRLRRAGRIPQRRSRRTPSAAYCQSTVVRAGRHAGAHRQDGRAVRRLQPAAAVGRPAASTDQAFTLVGRLQYSYAGGRWTEWIAAVRRRLAAASWAKTTAPSCSRCRSSCSAQRRRPRSCASARPPRSTARPTRVASNEQVALVSAQGELPRAAAAGPAVRDGRTAQRPGPRCSASTTTRDPPGAYLRPLGAARRPAAHRACATNRRKDEKGRSFNCPNCGSPVTVAAGRQQEHHLPLLQQPDRPDARHRRRAAACGAGRAGAAADPARQRRPAAGRATGRWSASSTAWAWRPATTSISAGANTCSTTRSAASASWSMPRTAGAS